MRALLWKDWRINRFVLIVGTVILFLPYLFFLIHIIYTQWYWPVGQMRHWNYEIVTACAYFSLILSLVPIAMLGGKAMAAERADRSAEFLAYLPPSRRSLIASKIILAVGASLVIWIVNLGNLMVLAPRMPGAPPLADGALWQTPGTGVLVLGGTTVLIFGVAWLLSSFVASSTVATGCGVITWFGIYGGLASVHLLHPFPILGWYYTLCLTVGILGFTAGTVVYLRRFVP